MNSFTRRNIDSALTRLQFAQQCPACGHYVPGHNLFYAACPDCGVFLGYSQQYADWEDSRDWGPTEPFLTQDMDWDPTTDTELPF